MIKFILKKVLPNKIIKIITQNYFYKIFTNIFLKQIIKNFFKTKYKKKVLISYITSPFKKGFNLSHTSYIESLKIAEVFNKLGYIVDIVDYDYEFEIDFSKYDIVFGFGNPFCKRFFFNKKNIITIHYATGMHIFWQNYITLKRIKDVYDKTKIWFLNSARIVEFTWSPMTILPDSIISLGNSASVETHSKYYNGNIYCLSVPFYKTVNFIDVINNKNFNDAKKNFLWFGAAGAIHKGLDLLLDYFSEKTEFNLHICGPINLDYEFERYYYNKLYRTPNIKTYGFVSLDSNLFYNLLVKCAFAIFPTCSEGGAASIINIMGNGGLIPLVTKYATIDVPDENLIISDFSIESIEKSINYALTLNEDVLKQMSHNIGVYICDKHSIENYEKNFQNIIVKIVNDCQL